MANSTFNTKTIYLLSFVDGSGREVGLSRTRRMPDGSVIDNSSSHYLGHCADLQQRMKRHYQGRGAAIIRAALARGLKLKLVRIWAVPAADALKIERHLKTTNHAGHYCPTCAIERERPRLVKLSLKLKVANVSRHRFIKQSITRASKRLAAARAQLREADNIAHLLSSESGGLAKQIAARKLAAFDVRSRIAGKREGSGF